MLNYNISLLKTIKDPLFQSFEKLIENLDDVLASNRSAKDLAPGEIVNIIGCMQMIGLTSLYHVSKDIRFAIEQLQKSESVNWDHIRVSEVARAIKDLVGGMWEQVRSLEQEEKKMSVLLWPNWLQLQTVMKKEQPNIEVLFDPDPEVSPDNFSALDLNTLTTTSQPHLSRMEVALQNLAKLLNKSEFSQENWDNNLKNVETVFEWAYALKHRFGYHGYWLAGRARIAYELLNSGKNTTTDNDQLLQSLQTAQVELRKFVSDSRKPRPDAVQQMLQPLLHPWPLSWDAMYLSLSEVKEVFGLEKFWETVKMVKVADKEEKNSTGVNVNELLEAVQVLKKTWTNLSASEEPDPRPFLRGLMTFLPKYELFHNPGSKNLLDALKTVAHRFVSARRNDVSQDFAQEVAVALLVIEETIAKKGSWPSELEKQSELAKKRVQLAANDEHDQLVKLPTVTWGVEKSRQQSRGAISKVVQEVMKDLAFIEEVFDDYFRHDHQEARRHIDEVKNKMLTSLSILNALGQHNAVLVMQEVNHHLLLLNRNNPQDYKKEYASLSIALTGLTTFLNAFEKGDSDAIRLLEPALKHIGANKEKDKALSDFEPTSITIDDVEEITENTDSDTNFVATQDELNEPLLETPNEDENIQSSNDGLEEVSTSEMLDTAPTTTFIESDKESEEEDEEIVDQSVSEMLVPQPIETVEVETMMPSQDELNRMQVLAQKAFDNTDSWTDKVVDEELTEAYLEEGVLVLQEIDQLRQVLLGETTRDTLVDLRRQFHTLKGSSRTTQLWGSGEFARRIENRINEAVNKSETYDDSLDLLVQFAAETFEDSFGSLLNDQIFVWSEDTIGVLKNAIEDSDRVLDVETSTEELSDDNENDDFNSLFDQINASDDQSETDSNNNISLDSVREEELVRLEQVHTEENTAAIDGVSGIVQVEVERLQQHESDSENLNAIYNETVDDSINDEQIDAILEDLETHCNNLIEVLNKDDFDVSLTHWSAHTIASLSAMLKQNRFHAFAKNYENVLSSVSELDSVLVTPATINVLKNACELLLEKASELLVDPQDLLVWSEEDEKIVDQIRSFDIDELQSEEATESVSVSENFENLFEEQEEPEEEQEEPEEEQEEPEEEQEEPEEEQEEPEEEQEEPEEEQEVKMLSEKHSVFIEVEKDVASAEVYHDMDVETEAEIVSAIANKMAIIAQETSQLHKLWEKLAELKNNADKF